MASIPEYGPCDCPISSCEMATFSATSSPAPMPEPAVAAEARLNIGLACCEMLLDGGKGARGIFTWLKLILLLFF